MLPTTDGTSSQQGFDLKKILAELPRLSRACSFLVVLLFTLGFIIPSLRNVFAISAQFFLAGPTAFIKIFTAGFFEASFLSLIANVLLFLMEGRYLEPLWGSKEFFKFVVIINFVTSVSTYLAIVIVYMVTMNEHFLYTHLWYGFGGVTAGLLVGVKQANPDLEVKAFGVVPLRVQFVPLALVVLYTVFLIIGIQVPSVPFVIFGTCYSWFYLRFMQKRGDVQGDLSDEFSLVSFFPAPLSPIVGVVAGVSYRLFALVGLWKLLGIPGLDAQGKFKPFPSPVTVAASSDSVDAERRRARAAQALENRLAQMEAQKKAETATASAGAQ